MTHKTDLIFTRPTSPDDSYSSPIGNSFSSPNGARRRSRHRSSTPSAFATQPLNQSRFTTSDANPALTPTLSSRRGGRCGERRATSTTPVNAAAIPTSIDNASASFEGCEGMTPTMLGRCSFGGTNISVEDVNEAICRFLKHFRDSSTASQSEDGLLKEGKYEVAIKRVIEIEGELLDVNARDVFDYDPDFPL